MSKSVLNDMFSGLLELRQNLKFPCVDCITLPICRNNRTRPEFKKLVLKCPMLKTFILLRGIFDLDIVVIRKYFETGVLGDFDKITEG